MTTLIFANGEIDALDWVRPYLAEASWVVAADGGSRFLFMLEHLPDVTVGDLDSVSAEIKRWLRDGGCKIITFPPEKDEIDLELTLHYVVERCEDPILIFGASGGRLDQSIANLLLLAQPDFIDRDIRLVEQYQSAFVTRTVARFNAKAGDTISLVPLGGDALIANSENLKWPLHDSTLRWSYARGISNVMTGDRASVTVADGTLLCIHIDQRWNR